MVQKVYGFTQNRNVALQIPAAFNLNPRTPRPLILILHPLGGNSTAVKSHLGFTNLFTDYSADGAFVIAPDGTGDSLPGPATAWNASTACCENDGPPPSYPTADYVYLKGIITDAKSYINRVGAVDSTRVYVIGESNGGFMAYRLACLDSADVTGIVVVAGAGDTASDAGIYGACDTTHHVNVMHVHGSGDSIVAYAGGSPIPGVVPAMDNVRGAESSAEVYSALNGCTSPGSLPAVASTLDLETNQAGSETEKRPWAGCPTDGQVTFYKVVAGGHSTGWTMNGTVFHDEVVAFIQNNHR